MTIDIRFILPFVIPFCLLWFAKGFFWVAGVEVDAEKLALICLFGGVWLGSFFSLDPDDKKWKFKIGGQK